MRGGAKLKDLNLQIHSIADFEASYWYQERGKAELGDKTMLDVWIPAAETIKKLLLTRRYNRNFKTRSLKANQAMELQRYALKKGRSSKLGERSRGHIDPGAASAQ